MMDEDKNKKDQEQKPETDLVETPETNTEETTPVLEETPSTENTDSESPVAEVAEGTTPEEVTEPNDNTEAKAVEETPTDDVVADPDSVGADETPAVADEEPASTDNPNAKWYVVHTASGHENKVATTLGQRIESEHLEHKILDVLVPTQEKIEIRGGKKGMIKEKIFPGYILVKMVLDDQSWLSVRTTPGVTSFVGIGNKPTPIPEHEVKTIIKYMSQGAAPTYKDVFLVNDTVKIVDGPFSEFIGKVDTVDKEKGKVRILVSIFGRETPVELDFLQVQKL